MYSPGFMRGVVFRYWLTLVLMSICLVPALSAQAATAVDLSVSAYTWTPDPVVRGGTSTFSVTVTNNDAGVAADTPELTIQLPANVDFSASTPPAGCSFNLTSTPKTLSCSKSSPLAALATWNTSFSGVGLAAGTQQTTATVSDSANTDPNSGNDALTKNTTVINGADLTVSLTGPGSAVAGSIISFMAQVTNNGPDAATTFRVTNNLPAAVDFTYQSASGSGWSCSQVTTTVTCNYAGAAIASGALAPDITITGRVITAAGSITDSASVVSTDGTTGDPNAGNNGPVQAIVTITPGTDLRANKTMVSVATGMTSYATGETVNLTLSATNQGPQNATGVTIIDTVPDDFTIGILPAGCTATGQAITCTIGALNNGVTSSSFLVPLTVTGAAGSSGTNTATVARTGPVGGSNTAASVNYTISDPFAHLTIAKTKGPNPVQAGQNITNTITVTNSTTSTSAATGTIRVTDELDANEIFVSSSGSGWSCAEASGIVTCDYAGANLARGASLPVLTITTQAASGFLGTITNTACTGQSAGSPHIPADNSTTGNCQSRSVTGTDRNVDLAIAKVASIASPTHILTTDNSFSYTLTIANSGPDIAPTVAVTDALAAWYSGDAGTTGGSAVITGQGAGESCSFGSTVTCTLVDVTNGSPRTVTITLNRPFRDGAIANTATVSTPDAIDSDGSNDSASADVIIDPIADVAVTSISDAPDPVKVGVELTYITSIKNNGPSTAAGVILRHTIDPDRMTYVPGSAALTVGGSCSYVASFSGAPYAGEAGIECSGFSLTNGESRQLSFAVIPVYPYPDALAATYSSSATVSTTTVESNSGNNTATNDAHVDLQALDLAVTDNDPGYDPTAFGDAIVYQVQAQNNGPSQATGFTLMVLPTAPVGGYSMPFDPAGSTLPSGASCSQPGGIGTNVICYLGVDQAHSILAANSSQTFNLKFGTAGPTPSSSLTYSTTATVSSYETSAGYDSLPGNNAVSETTTVLPKTDLILVSKTVSKGTVDINEPFTYTVTVGNKGPSDVSGLTVSDTLPAGFVMTGAPTVTAGSAFTLSTSSCTAPAVGSGGTVSCILGTIPADASGTDATRQATITIPVRAAYQSSGTYSFSFNSNISNTATVAVLPGVSLDPDGTNNSQTVNVQVRRNSIAGAVFRDTDTTLMPDSTGKTRLAATLTLTGTDAYGYTYGSSSTYPALTRTNVSSGTSGGFTFNTVPPGTWVLVETQPSGYSDGREAAGTAGGTAPSTTLDGTLNGSNSAAHNTISGISLPADTATVATGYLFQEFQNATISGSVYHDANNDGNKDASETTGISGVAVHLTGTDYRGLTYTPSNANTNGSGTYSFSNVPPGSGYVVSETSQPTGWLEGLDQNGSGLANVITGSNTTDTITVGVATPGTTYGNRNFGELLPATISGYVFIDVDSDATRDAGETAGVTGVPIALTGTDDLGNAVSLSTTSAANGSYSFTGLRPSDATGYTLTETPPTGLTHTGSQAGSKGGTGAGVGLANVAITAIPIASNDTATGYNFGESGQGLAGFVYVDRNANGVMDSGDFGISGVTVTLSGTTAAGVSVCTAISPNPCSVTTDATGAYAYTGLPASNGSGYTLTEQSQAAAPLTNYGDGTDATGTLGGSAGNDVIAAIPLATGQFGANYNFGEIGGGISGLVYHDVNDNGAYNAGTDSGIAGVTITLSGTTANGVNVCSVMPSCTATTAADGSYAFAGVPASNGSGYALTETQPADYADRTNTVGSAGGAASVNTFTGVVLSAGGTATGYQFGEKTGSLSGHVYVDSDNDGVLDGGETGIDNVSVRLTGTAAGGSVIDVTVTSAADGSYTFTNLPNGTYTLTETQPAGYLDGIHSAGAGGGTTSVANSISAISFSAATAFTDYNFGELQAAQISGRTYFDANNNGSYDSGEALAGATITLTGTDDQGNPVNATTTTAADGTYSFADLRPGTYTVTETQPAGIADYPGTTGTQVGTISAVTVGTPALNAVSAIVLSSGNQAINYDFRENAASLSGFVYFDSNDNGVMDAGEIGIPGVTITLSGTATGSTSTASDGSYQFIGLVSGSYTLTETHPVIYQDGRETAGSQGGTVDNTSFSLSSAQNTIASITLSAGTAGTGYLFGERTGLPGSFSGTVWFNSVSKDQTQQAGEPGLSGWLVEVVQGGVVRGSTTSDSDGAWTIGGLAAGAGYEIRFRHPGNNALYGVPVSQDPGYVDSTPDYSGFTIANMTLRSGGNVINQNLPIDPSGVVYDSITRLPVPGATVTIAGPAGFDPGSHLLGGTANQSQITGSNGYYQFLLLPGAPSGVYTLAVTAPPGYVPGASAIIPPETGSYVPGTGVIQSQASPPTGSQPTTYYLSFTIDSTSPNIINNHIPVDPILSGALVVTKTTPLVNVVRGDLVPYTIRVRNTLSATVPNIILVDQLPPGFKYRSGSARINGLPVAPTADGRTLRWPGLTFTAGEEKVITLVLTVGTGVSDGVYTNYAWAINSITSDTVSNRGQAAVRIVPDPTFDCSDVIGKVFDDGNANGYQDDGEPGIPNVRVATAKGWLITTDAEGRFHVACAAIPQLDRGSNFVMKLDERTLPSGYRVTTENPRVVRLTRGKLTKLNFGATIHRVVRVEVSDGAFVAGGDELLPEWAKRFADLPVHLKNTPSVLRLAYRLEGGDRQRAEQRLDHLAALIRERWRAMQCCYPLAVETELVEVGR